MKKVLALFLSVVMCLSMIGTIAFASPVPKVSLSSAEGSQGEEVTINVAVSDNSGIAYLKLKIAYPGDALTLTAVENKNVFSGSFTASQQLSQNPYVLTWTSADNMNSNGIVAVLKFRISEAATAGEKNIVLTIEECYDKNYDDVTITDESGKVNVKAASVSVSGVALNKKTLSLNTGDQETLIATVLPDNATNKAVTWKSSDSSVASVSDTGKVTAIKEGTATITVTTQDGSYSASCTVSVGCGHTNKTETPSKSPDCVNPGNNRYYTCAACGTAFKADGVTETTVEAEKLPALGHDFTEKLQDAAHLVPGSGADCQSVKKYYYDCSRCNVMGTVTFNSTQTGGHQMETAWTTENGKHYHACGVPGCTYIADEALCSGGTATCLKKAVCAVCAKEYGELGDHDLTHHAKVEADHTKPGNMEYWTCDICGKYFKDASGKQEIARKDTVISQIPHSHGTAWEKNDTQHWNECACGDKINVGEHNYDNAGDSTCNTCGYNRTVIHTWETEFSHNAAQHWIECSQCGTKKDMENHFGGTATCAEKAVCQVCGQSYGELADCDLTGEKPEAAYLKSQATCVSAAVYYKSCTVCGKAGTETFTYGAVDAGSHGNTELRDQVDASCSAEGYTGDTWCKDCGTKLAEGKPIVIEHQLDEVEAKAATHEAEGNIAYYVCISCQQLFADDKAAVVLEKADTVIPKGEHSYEQKSDAQKHWKECPCGSKAEVEEHTFGDWVITKEAEIGVDGSKERACTVCSYKQTEKILAAETPATGDIPVGMLIAMLALSTCGVMVVVCLAAEKRGKYQR